MKRKSLRASILVLAGTGIICLLSSNKPGDIHGSIMVSSDDGIWRKIESGTRKNIHTLALFKGTVIAGTDGGHILLGDKNGFFSNISLPVKGNVVSLSARASACFGVTDKGEILQSKDGLTWEVLDFNSIYAGYYDTCLFEKVLTTEHRIFVTGVKKDGSPVLFFSRMGGVWTERYLDYSDDQGIAGYVMDTPKDIFYDDRQDQLFLVCNNGKLVLLPSCARCNKLMSICTDDLTGIAGHENTMVVAGENFFLHAMSLK